MKTIYLLFTSLFLLICLNLTAQPPHEGFEKKREKIEELKIAFITQKLELTPQEAQVFWPIYNVYNKERHEIMQANRPKGPRMEKEPDFKNISEKDAETMLYGRLDNEQKMVNLNKLYLEEFKKAISYKKILVLYESEHEFKKDLLRKMGENHRGEPVKD